MFKIIKTIVSLILSLLFLICIFIGGYFAGKKGCFDKVFNIAKNKVIGNTINEDASNIEITTQNSSNIMLTAMPLTASIAQSYGIVEDNYPSYMLTAAITPDNADNKAVDWTVAGGSGFTGNAADYLTVNSLSDGSLTARLICKKAFAGEIEVIVTTRSGGYTAKCIVAFVGNPSEVKIDTGDVPIIYDPGYDIDIIELKTLNTYEFKLSLDNVFGKVDSSIIPEYTFETAGIGEFYLETGTRNVFTDELTPSETINLTYQGLTIIPTPNGGIYSLDLYTVTLDGNNIVIETKSNTLESINDNDIPSIMGGIQIVKGYLKFGGYADENKKPYLQINVTETNTGLTQTINLRIGSDISGVSLDKTIIEV